MSIQSLAAETSKIVRENLLEYYGISASLRRLPGENLNFLVATEEGDKFVAKIAGRNLPVEVVEMEFAALAHARNAQLSMSLSGIIVNKNKKIETRIKMHINEYKRLIVHKYISGKCMSEITDISGTLRFRLGKRLAEFGRAMENFVHAAAHRSHRWDLTHADQHRASLEWITDVEKNTLLTWAYVQYTKSNTGNLSRLPWQFIHGDWNPENILIAGDEVVGLLDFGDSSSNPAVCELAICLAYQMMDQADPWAVAAQVIAGYETVRQLTAEERKVLLPLICGRLAVTISVATERRQIDPGHPNWFVSESKAWQVLEKLRNHEVKGNSPPW